MMLIIIIIIITIIIMIITNYFLQLKATKKCYNIVLITRTLA